MEEIYIITSEILAIRRIVSYGYDKAFLYASAEHESLVLSLKYKTKDH